MKRLIKTALARSLLVGAAFGGTAVLTAFFDLAPERSASDWGFLSVVLLLLSLFSGLTVAYCEVRVR